MSDLMRPQPFEVLLEWILGEYKARGEIFGIPKELFWRPRPNPPFGTELFGEPLGTPIGPAAGPHTQLAQNIVSAWLCGGRFIELKTVQVLDELEIPRPCIDMEDEGYNVEWSQELKLSQSAWEYIKAWVLVHVLPHILGWGDVPFDTQFNMSVGYDFKGITSPPMLRFMDRLADASSELAELRGILRERHPELAEVEIPERLTGSVTLSTMHGCPPDEIEGIARYLLEERGLHTFIKLNPTLLGKDEVLRILHDHLGFREIEIPDSVFEKDLEYDRAVELIKALKEVAEKRGLVFGVKLSNTLAMRNHKGVLPGEEMYMSGRALYPVTMNLFWRLAQEFEGELFVSYAGGADALNVAEILSCGALPVTVASDLLKPGGYARFHQYLEEIEAEMDRRGARELSQLSEGALANLERAAKGALESPRYKKAYFRYGLPKTSRGLPPFDCIAAPCVEECGVRQDVPEYIWWIGKGDPARALEAILARNPLPGVTGYVCTQLCKTRCTRNSYEAPVAIRALKRFAFAHGTSPEPVKSPPTGKRVAIVGAGPAGLSAAYFLARSGVSVTIYEAKDRPGGMMHLVPPFRLPDEVIRADVERILALGVDLRLSQPVTIPPEELLREGYDAVFIACGTQEEVPLHIEGIEGAGVWSGLELLEEVRAGARPALGRKVVVIGGGDTAMDAARAARRLGGEVIVAYRRSRAEMPASQEELSGALEEGVRLLELVSPMRVLREDGRVVGVELVRNELGEPGPDGRRRPVPIQGSEFVLPADSLVVAIGQRADLAFLSGSKVDIRRVEAGAGRLAPRIYAGGDVTPGPHSIIAACGDGLRAAQAICRELGVPFREPDPPRPELSRADIVGIKRMRARREPPRGLKTLPPQLRTGFQLIEDTYTEEEAKLEAARCLQCSALCDKCVEVCPNRANLHYFVSPVDWQLPRLKVKDGGLEVAGWESFRVAQARQILHIDDLCNECGNCATFCVHQGKPYREKPRLFFRLEDIYAEEGNAFHIAGSTVYRKEGGQLFTLQATDAGYLLSVVRLPAREGELVVRVAGDFSQVEGKALGPFEGELSLKVAAEMAVLLEGARRSLPFLPIWRR
ncbi:MAG: Selenate reductase YgfK [Acetothermia bacterium 64_32]|nr:MAG: Selenate reductase YgfK [Acetothermia bacterium 64_32]HAF70964.1 putative selenate reductase subunit YgfK [Candidatus Acetothermia bacterium]